MTATKTAIAIRQAEALARVRAAVAALQKEFGLEERELTPFQRDPDMARALQLEAVAGLLEEVAAKVAEPKVLPPPDGKKALPEEAGRAKGKVK